MASSETPSVGTSSAPHSPPPILEPPSSPEYWHTSFRSFRGFRRLNQQQDPDPLQDLVMLRHLCWCWLRPDLHSKMEILDMLVLEQFLISQPLHLQALVLENGVKNCQELEQLLQNLQKPQKWSIVTVDGKTFLARHSDAGKAPEEDSVRPEPQDSVCETPPETPLGVSTGGQEPPQTCQESGGQVFSGNRPSYKQEALMPELESGKEELDTEREMEPLGEMETEPGMEPELEQQEKEEEKEKKEEKKEEEEILHPGFLDTERSRDGASGSTEGAHRLPGASKRKASPSASGPRRSQRARCPRAASPSGSPQRNGASPRGRVPAARPGERPPLVCDHCPKVFFYKSQLDIHRRSHTGERPFSCASCGRGFMQPSDLRVHQRIHNNQRPYSCSVCGATFTHQSTLTGHMRMHTQERPFACDQCGQLFSHRGNLNVHLRTHSGLKPYSCPVCSRDFRQLGTFNRHKKTHLCQDAPEGPETSVPQANLSEPLDRPPAPGASSAAADDKSEVTEGGLRP